MIGDSGTLASWVGTHPSLKPNGIFVQREPDIRNSLALIEKAVMIEPNSRYPGLDSLKRHLASKGS
jgi:hypothetical protein